MKKFGLGIFGQAVLVVLVIFLWEALLWAGHRIDVQNSLPTILPEQNAVQFSIALNNFSSSNIREARMYFRSLGEIKFRWITMQADGFRYLATLPLDNLDHPVLEYYYWFAFDDGTGETYPEEPGEESLLRADLQLESGFTDETILILSPEPNEELFTDELVITASFPALAGRVDPERTRVYLDKWDVSRYVSVYDDFLTFAPRTVPPGRHRVEVQLFDKTGRLLAKRSWQFVAYGKRGVSAAARGGVEVHGRVYGETRQEVLLDSLDQNYSQGGLNLNLHSRAFQLGGRVFLSNQEKTYRQPINRYSAFARLQLDKDRYLRVAGGDEYPQYNNFLIQNVLVRGFHADLFLKFFNLQFSTGQNRRAIEGTPIQTIQGPDTTLGTFQRKLWALRASFGARKKFQLGFTFVHGKDEENSIRSGGTPQESFSAGTDLFLAFDRQRIILEGSINANLFNSNIASGTIPFDTLKALNQDLGADEERVYNLAKKFITVNEYLILFPQIAWEARARLRYLGQNFIIGYSYVDDDFNSLGQPYLLRDSKGLYITDNIRMLENKLFVTLGLRFFRNNVANSKPTTTTNNNVLFNLSYFPGTNLPTFSFGINNNQRQNDALPNDPLAAPEDSRTRTINLASSYNLYTGQVRHAIVVSFVNYDHQDLDSVALNNSNSLSLNVQSYYNSPLQTNLEVSFQETESAPGTGFASDLSFNSFGGGIGYSFSRLASQEDRLFFQFNAKYGKTNTARANLQTPLTTDNFNFNRLYLGGRLTYAVPTLGRLTLRADYFNYTGDQSFKNYVLSARYEYSF